jgi:hypothetical protein
MLRPVLRRIAAVTTAVLLLRSQPARAEEPSPLRVSYQADASCPSANAFLDLVRTKVPSVGLSEASDEEADTFVILRSEGASFVGQLRMGRRDGTRYAREIVGASCEEAASAVAFVLALAVSGQEETMPPEKHAAAVPTTLPAETERPAPPPTVSLPDWGWTAGAELGARSGLAPTWSLVEAGFGELCLRRATPTPLTFRLSLLRSEQVAYSDATGVTRFSWVAARGEVSMVRVRLVPFELVPSLGLDVGRIRAVGAPFTPLGRGRTQSSVWVDGMAALRLELRVWSMISAQVGGELVVTLTPYEFAFDTPNTPVYTVPNVAVAGLVGFAAQIP